jgi:hypothetical protein
MASKEKKFLNGSDELFGKPIMKKKQTLLRFAFNIIMLLNYLVTVTVWQEIVTALVKKEINWSAKVCSVLML